MAQSTVFTIIGLAILITGILISIILTLLDKSPEAFLFSAGLGFLLGFLFIIAGNNLQKAETWNKAVTSGFLFYLNGEEVTPDNVDPFQYIISYDDSQKKVFMLPKTYIRR